MLNTNPIVSSKLRQKMKGFDHLSALNVVIIKSNCRKFICQLSVGSLTLAISSFKVSICGVKVTISSKLNMGYFA